ncbi:ABC transporter permease [Hydrogenophaga sp. 5NK40-0174]
MAELTTASSSDLSAAPARAELDAWDSHTGRNDMWVAMRSTHVWGALGWHDIRQRYRRSVLGPFWFTLSTFIMVGVLGVLYSTLLKQDVKTYLPYLGVGLVLWQYLSTTIQEGSNALIGAGFIIKQLRMPVTIHVARIAWRNFAILMHSLPVLVLFLLAMGNRPSMEFLLVIPGLILILLHGVWTGVILSIACLRFRDILPIVSNFLQVAFFFTPIMWMPELLKERAWIAHYNPLYHMIEVVRAPLLGTPIHWESWAWSIGLLVVGFALAQWIMQTSRNRLTYWL